MGENFKKYILFFFYMFTWHPNMYVCLHVRMYGCMHVCLLLYIVLLLCMQMIDKQSVRIQTFTTKRCIFGSIASVLVHILAREQRETIPDFFLNPT